MVGRHTVGVDCGENEGDSVRLRSWQAAIRREQRPENVSKVASAGPFCLRFRKNFFAEEFGIQEKTVLIRGQRP